MRGILRGGAVLGVAMGWILACGGGASVEPTDHFESICAATSVQLSRPMNLASLEPPVELEPGTEVAVDADGTVRVGWEEVSPDAGAQALADATRTVVESAELLGKTPRALVAVEESVPVERVAMVLSALGTHGLEQVQLIGHSSEAWELPPPLLPELAVEVRAELQGADPASRQTLLARMIEDEIALCPPAQDAFEAVAMAAPDTRCQLIAYGMSEALPMCPLTNGDRVLTLMQVIVEPTSAKKLSELPISLDEAAPAVEVAPGTPWSKALAKLKAGPEGARLTVSE